MELRQCNGNTHRGVGHDDIAEAAITDHAVIDPADPNASRIAGQVTVGHRHPFTDLIFPQGTVIGTDNDAIVTAGNAAICNGHIRTGIDMDAIVIGVLYLRIDPAFIKYHIAAIVDPVGPAGGLIDHGNILHTDILTTGEEHHSRRCGSIDPQVIPTLPGIGFFHEICAVAINRTHACDRNIFTFLCENQTGISVTRQVIAIVDVLQLGLFRVILATGRAQQRTVAGQVQFHTASQSQRAGHICTLCDQHTTTAGRHTGINGTLDGLGIQSLTIAYCTVDTDIKLSHAFSPFLRL